MSVDLFIPTQWSGKLLVALRHTHVYAQPGIVNRDYEGEIKSLGDTVKIHGIGDITLFDYVKNTDIAAPQELTDAETTLSITKAKGFNFAVDDVDAAQMNPQVMNEAVSRAAYKINDAIDTFVAGLYTDIATANSDGNSGAWITPSIGTDANVGSALYDHIVHLGTLLDQQDVPFEGRWCVLAPWQKEMLIEDRRFTAFGTQASRATLEDGELTPDAAPQQNYLGTINGMNIYWSNNAPHLGGTVGASGSQDVVLAGSPMAITFAEGLVKMVAYTPQYRFADAIKGLHLFGAKVVRPYALAAGYYQHP